MVVSGDAAANPSTITAESENSIILSIEWMICWSEISELAEFSSAQ
jgi:hypothetical protein